MFIHPFIQSPCFAQPYTPHHVAIPCSCLISIGFWQKDSSRTSSRTHSLGTWTLSCRSSVELQAPTHDIIPTCKVSSPYPYFLERPRCLGLILHCSCLSGPGLISSLPCTVCAHHGGAEIVTESHSAPNVRVFFTLWTVLGPRLMIGGCKILLFSVSVLLSQYAVCIYFSVRVAEMRVRSDCWSHLPMEKKQSSMDYLQLPKHTPLSSIGTLVIPQSITRLPSNFPSSFSTAILGVLGRSTA